MSIKIDVESKRLLRQLLQCIEHILVRNGKTSFAFESVESDGSLQGVLGVGSCDMQALIFAFKEETVENSECALAVDSLSQNLKTAVEHRA